MNSLTKIAACTICIGLFSGYTAHAGDLNQARKLVVSFADLDLAKPAGMEVLTTRLEAAASAVCGGWLDMRDLRRSSDYRACKMEALDGAMAQLSSRLAQLRQQHIAQAQ